MKKVLLFLAAAMLFTTSNVFATALDSSAFAYKYEADTLPSAASPAYTYASGSELAESSYATQLAGGYVKLDTDSIGGGQSGWYSLTGGTGTVWNPSFMGNYTMEVKMKSMANNGAAYNAWFDWYDENSEVLMQVWHNKVYLNGVEVTGLDNQSDFHTFRIVSISDGVSSAGQTFDLYRDGEKIITAASNWTNYKAYYAGTTGLFYFGDMTGYYESNITVDYIRWDTTGAYTPVPEPATMTLFAISGLALLRRKK